MNGPSNFPPARSPDYRNVLVLASCGIGDVILATPLFANIKRFFPGSSITLVLRGDLPLEIRELNRHIDETLHYPSIVLSSIINRRLPAVAFSAAMKMLAAELSFLRSLRKRGFDLSLSLFPGGKSEPFLLYCSGARRRVGPRYRMFGRTVGSFYTDTVVWDAETHVVENNLDLLRAIGIDPVIKTLLLEPRDEDVGAADALFRENGLVSGDTLIGVHAGISRSRNYWPLDRVVELVGYLFSRPGIKVAVFAGPDEAGVMGSFAHLPVIPVAGRSFGMTCACIARCSIVFNSDTMLGHLAAALRVPTVTIYGNGNQDKYQRWGVEDFSINKLPLSRYPGPDEDFWAGEHGKAALEKVTVGEVTALFERALAASRNPAYRAAASRPGP